MSVHQCGVVVTFRRVLVASAGTCLLFAGPFTAPSSATILQFGSVAYEVGGNTVATRQDTVTGQGSIDRDILVEISSPSATTSVGRFGDVGMSASLFGGPTDGSAQVRSIVNIVSDEFVNFTPFTQRVTSSFVIDGGTLQLIDSANATVQFHLSLKAFFGNTKHQAFESTIRLTSDSSMTPSLTTLVADLGATLSVLHGHGIATIPLSFQTAELGILAPHEGMTLDYLAEIDLTRGPGEGLTANYSDPLHVSTHPVLGDITFTPASDSTIPEPSGLALFGIGLATAAVSLLRRLRTRPTPQTQNQGG
jgi:hypothetical protein